VPAASSSTSVTGTTIQPAPTAVRYGGVPGVRLEKLGSTLDAFVPFTQAITEDFFAQFMVLDVLGLWVPRIWNSLARGRDKYEAENDPTWHPGLNEFQQTGKIMGGWLKGLNWGYFLEEAGREFLIGPGVFSIFASTYGAYRATLNQAIRLPMPALTQLTDTLGQHIRDTAKSAPKNQSMDAVAFKAKTLGMLNNLIADGPARQAAQKPYQQWLAAWGHYLETAHQYQQQRTQGQHVKASVKHWWQTRPFKAKPPGNDAPLGGLIAAEKRLQTAGEALKEGLLSYTLKQADQAFDQMHTVPVRLMKRDAQKRRLTATTTPMDIDQFLNWTHNWRHVPKTLMKEAQPNRPGAEQVARLLGRLTRSKMLGAIGGLLVVAVYTLLLTKSFQSSKAYPGNRSRRASDISGDAS
jgi:hypothetical protein